MVHDGFLIRHAGKKAHVCFFRLEEGYLKYYANDKLIGDLRLSGCRVSVKAHRRDDHVQNTFRIETQRVLVKDRTYTLAPPEMLELTAATTEARSLWGRAILTWQRRYFAEPASLSPSEHEATRAALEAIVKTSLKPLGSPSRYFITLPSRSLRKSLSSTFHFPPSTRSQTPVLTFTLPTHAPVTIAS
ncbi:hypothetical protein SDRG_17209 [Saprolegnia diclina VS20]|uniref:PH domain-containing protein n=1 Tax=Saprolegnia diclina (strain VS20) TaxID=1156394 RepID=T0R5X8_SAPDV|nr:hypothetical protein SDRG_17209 [Saprolegnia diclina VS20]EQC24902.1 hypothetical protein SDRG_17209 [Saprolegnia diclina VS20]|eukprot:XP_008621670.1 hypothetical protein SDRG_17209 [Saprolegnia diclina VS20]